MWLKFSMVILLRKLHNQEASLGVIFNLIAYVKPDLRGTRKLEPEMEEMYIPKKFILAIS